MRWIRVAVWLGLLLFGYVVDVGGVFGQDRCSLPEVVCCVDGSAFRLCEAMPELVLDRVYLPYVLSGSVILGDGPVVVPEGGWNEWDD